MKHYQALEKIFCRLHNLEHLGSITGWDEASKMPEGGGDARAKALTELSLIEHEIITNPDLGGHFKGATQEIEKTGTNWQKANLLEMKRYWKDATCLNKDLVERKSLATIKCGQIWRELRAKNDWDQFLPYQKEVIEISKEESQVRAKMTGLSPYDSLLDMYEPGLHSIQCDGIFDELKSILPDLIKRIQSKQKEANYLTPKGPFPTQKQKELGMILMKKTGFDFQHGRLDESHHPFCGGVPDDVRITSRYDENDLSEGLMGVLHETGHAKYEQSLPKEWRSQPVGKARGMAFHEGQSLLMEMQICRSRSFLNFATPFMADIFGKDSTSKELTPENLYKGYTKVTPDFIRVNADEVTYPLHVILRYEIEKEIIEGALETKDLPKIWDEKMIQYFGLSTKGNDKDGCMQDGHWPGGAFGYFPSYTIGALIAAQLFKTLNKDLPEAMDHIASGNFSEIDQWLREKVWSKGCLLSGDELLKQATGESLNSKYFIDHLKNRYLL